MAAAIATGDGRGNAAVSGGGGISPGWSELRFWAALAVPRGRFRKTQFWTVVDQLNEEKIADFVEIPAIRLRLAYPRHSEATISGEEAYCYYVSEIPRKGGN